MRRADAICVTGLAWSTPLGSDLDEVWRRLLDGASGLRDTRCPYPLRTTLSGMVPGLAPDVPAGERQVQLAVSTLRAAYASAGLDPADPAVRLVLGTSFGASLDEPAAHQLGDWARESARRIGHPRQPVCISTACSAGSDSILVASRLIQAGVCDRCLAGGVDVVTLAKRLGHSALGTMSRDRLRAFDERHDGMVPGEGAGVLVLESADSARRRGVPVHAVLGGSGSANDATGLTAPDRSGDGVVRTVERCLADAGREASQISLINAHATGTPINDEVESAGLGRLFGSDGARPVVFATKGAFGHGMGATGAIEAVAVVLALRDGRVPPIVGLDRPRPDFPLPLVAGTARDVDADVGLSLTIGFGGFTTCLLFARVGTDER